jgi:CxxC motif-containing protein (DUF1111 family)
VVARAHVWVLALCACSATEDLEVAAVFGPPGAPLPFATEEALVRFERGRDVFVRRFDPEGGLGPSFNGVACGSCHEKPVFGGSASRYRNAFVVVSESQVFRLEMQRQYSVEDARAPDRGLAVARNSGSLFGLGLLAEIGAEEIIANSDPLDVDGDGVSGRVNFDRGFVGRFGSKAQIAGLDEFVRLALVDHLGITSDPAEIHDLMIEEGPLALAQRDGDAIADPEIAPADVADLIAFVSLLAAPAPEEEPGEGSRVFERIGCAACHLASLSGPRGPIPAYTDLLLHDMGPELADGIELAEASGAEFRTPPLWGLASSGPYLHDGRADTIEEAIVAHGGEATRARESYVALAAGDREALGAFLRSLGGSEFRNDGLLPPASDVPPAGALGGPRAELSPVDRERFERGRVLFDRDFSAADGLGPRFNGDACRSCHFDGAIGGAGPADVDVIRQGVIEGGEVVAPSAGTMAHRHGTDWTRPAVDPGAELFERRQTPPAFGLGLIDAIDEAAILALQDPDDADGDGIRGRARIVGGRVGRFGWKAGVPTLLDFVRDALTNELGLTLPPDAASAFGAPTDGDGAPDPELDEAALDDLVVFMRELAPPPRGAIDAAVQGGASVFEAIGCAACHVPALPAAGGTFVPLYSDLLLHDVAAPERLLVPDGDATRELRTPPLWGLSLSAPYLHDGRARTIEDAIRAHAAEATRARQAYDALAQEEKADLLRFLESL